jgi:hypothetical protein
VVVVPGGAAQDEDGLSVARPGVLDEALLAPPLDGAVCGGQAEAGSLGQGCGVELADAEGAAHGAPGLEQGGAAAVVSARLHRASIAKMKPVIVLGCVSSA